MLKNNFAKRADKKSQLLVRVLETLPEVSIENVIKHVIDTEKDYVQDKMSVSISRRDYIELNNNIIEYQKIGKEEILQNEYEIYAGAPITSIVEAHKIEKLITVLPKALNVVLGGGLPKNESTNILIYAVPEVGKTLFALNMAYGFCAQGLRVLYIGNEESARALQLRTLGRFATYKQKLWPRASILADPDQAYKDAMKHGYTNFTLAPLTPGSITDVRNLILQVKPDVLILDQLHNLVSFSYGAEMEQLTKASQAIRSLGKEHNLITVNITQAKENGHLVLSKADVFNSNILVPGDMDVMIGLGMNWEMEKSNRRMISIPKNKVSGWHGSFLVKFLPEVSKVVSLS
jgi:hypothetical protein